MYKKCLLCLVVCLLTTLTSKEGLSQTGVAKSADKAPAKAAQGTSEPLEITLERRKVLIVNGKESLETATTAKPGEMLEDSAVYTNKSKNPISKLEATLPIPQNTELQLSSMKPAGAKASTDGINFSAIPLKRKIKQPNGVETEQLVPTSEYRYLRWYPGTLAAGQRLVFSARFKVADDAPPTK
ncbi:MAG: hypothetical protein JNM52_10305 [Betaproteobacteria bacterium]|nr:hypothetical protein [Betaproteobacteria bacterium]